MANGQLLCKSEVKKFIKAKRLALRPADPFSAVSDETLDQINGWLRMKLTRAVTCHRSIKTFKDFNP
jgi:hypothetical protein|tara:strand:+ start:692 stop:892 length:201 start_codon:yes stop_codon:yes gene_type:complete